MFYMVKNSKRPEHCDVLETSLAAHMLSLLWLALMVHSIDSGPFDSGIWGGVLFLL